MSLLLDLVQSTDEYAEAARSRGEHVSHRPAGGAGARARPFLLLGAVLLGVLLVVAVGQVRRSADQALAGRNALIERIDAQSAYNDDLHAQAGDLAGQVTSLRDDALVQDESGAMLLAGLQRLEATVGVAAVTGPGVRVTIDDAPAGSGQGGGSDYGRVLDADLQRVVNGLWAAGAEAISVNGQRLTALTAIRSADVAILVDYRPLTPPYEILAIGDSRTLAARFAAGPGGRWMQSLASLYGIGFDVSAAESLSVPADSPVSLRHVRLEGP